MQTGSGTLVLNSLGWGKMEKPTLISRAIRIGEFELDTRTGELSGAGRKLLLTVQPLQVLLVLLERPGELVTREELVRRVWPADTFVDFDHGLNKAINKLRDALQDSAESPSFIETLPRRGYRLIAPVGPATDAVPAPTVTISPERAPVQVPEPPTPGSDVELRAPQPSHQRRPRLFYLAVAGGVLLLLLGVTIVFSGRTTYQSLLYSFRPTRSEIASLAVLPLQNLSGNPEESYFADGMTDALITEVAKVGGPRVISRTSVMRYKGTAKNIQQIGRELNVDAVVEGTILRSGNRIRVTAQLIQVSTDMHLWADSFERDISEVLTLQQEVAASIARRIGAVVKPVESTRRVNPEAYGAYLKGRYHFLLYTADGW